MYKLYYCTFILFIYLSDASIVPSRTDIENDLCSPLYFPIQRKQPKYSHIHHQYIKRWNEFYIFFRYKENMCDLDILKYMKFSERNKQKKPGTHKTIQQWLFKRIYYLTLYLNRNGINKGEWKWKKYSSKSNVKKKFRFRVHKFLCVYLHTAFVYIFRDRCEARERVNIPLRKYIHFINKSSYPSVWSVCVCVCVAVVVRKHSPDLK